MRLDRTEWKLLAGIVAALAALIGFSLWTHSPRSDPPEIQQLEDVRMLRHDVPGGWNDLLEVRLPDGTRCFRWAGSSSEGIYCLEGGK